MQTTVTFESNKYWSYAVVQRGKAKMLVSRERGQRILDGVETVTFVQELHPQRKTRTRTTISQKHQRGLLRIEKVRAALGLSVDDPSVSLCGCGGNRTCDKCNGVGVLIVRTPPVV